MEWSKYQRDLFDFGLNDTRNALISAVAGSGKTASIEELCRRLPATTKIRYLVFNKKNAEEATRRMPPNVQASTFHSACMRPLRRVFGRIVVDDDKTAMLMEQVVKEHLLSEGEARKFLSPVKRLVGIAKNSGIGTAFGAPEDDVEAWQALAEHFGIEVELPRNTDPEIVDANAAQLIDVARGILWRSVQPPAPGKPTIIDYDDMLYFVSYFDVTMEQFDVVCVDEAQDTNALQRDLLRRMTGGRLIAVGDHRQAIYGFRGADATAMSLIRDQFNCVELPLSINYRCSTAVIEAAKQFCPQLEAHDGAPRGSVETLTALRLAEFGADDAVLCRTTAPLIRLALRLIGAHMPVTVLGRDIGAGLVRLVRKLANGDAHTVGQFSDQLDRYHAAEMKRLQKKKNFDKLAEALDDRVSALRAFIEPFDDEAQVGMVVSAIEALFADRPIKGGVTLSTVHKAKGLEWPTVYILERDNMPLPWARGWELEQEYNAVYVAYTRAKVDLRMVALADIGD